MMSLYLADYENRTHDVIKAFWGTRDSARQKQLESGKLDQGERGCVTAGKNLDTFLTMLIDIIKGNGLPEAEFHRTRPLLSLPGYFRPTKLWDLLVLHKGQLLAAIELKSQVGPSFGNNFNNRCEEVIGTGHDFWTAYREEAFGAQPRPFLGWLIVVEDTEASRVPVTEVTRHFPIFDEFKRSSYQQRYEILCRKLMQERLYTAATLITSPREAVETGEYTELSPMTGLRTFVTSLAGHIAGEAARLA